MARSFKIQAANAATPEQMYWENEARASYFSEIAFTRDYSMPGLLEFLQDVEDRKDMSIGHYYAETYRDMALHDRQIQQEVINGNRD
jgi:hypothetical protein